MTRRMLTLLAAAGSAAILLGAFGFQYIGGLVPCQMCIWQRWPHGAAVLIGLAALALPGRFWPLMGALAALTTAGIGVFHTGVEQHWWEGITACSGAGGIGAVSVDDLLNPAIEAGPPLIRCDEIVWSMFGLTMASWNAVISFGLALIWLAAWRRA